MKGNHTSYTGHTSFDEQTNFLVFDKIGQKQSDGFSTFMVQENVKSSLQNIAHGT